MQTESHPDTDTTPPPIAVRAAVLAHAATITDQELATARTRLAATDGVSDEQARILEAMAEDIVATLLDPVLAETGPSADPRVLATVQTLFETRDTP
ncbi:MAG: hypothetical protein ABEJ57_03655 [Halobacteriaceae archaeon]